MVNLRGLSRTRIQTYDASLVVIYVGRSIDDRIPVISGLVKAPYEMLCCVLHTQKKGKLFMSNVAGKCGGIHLPREP